MIKKEEILKIFENAKEAEEKSVSIYARHLSSAIFWTGIGKKEVERVRKLLDRLEKESESHAKMTEYLIELVEKDKRNAF